MEANIGKLKSELAKVRNAAIEAHLSGDRARADCLTGKAVGMKSTLEIVERVLRSKDNEAVGELEGMERVIQVLSPLPRC